MPGGARPAASQCGQRGTVAPSARTALEAADAVKVEGAQRAPLWRQTDYLISLHIQKTEARAHTPHPFSAIGRIKHLHFGTKTQHTSHIASKADATQRLRSSDTHNHAHQLAQSTSYHQCQAHAYKWTTHVNDESPDTTLGKPPANWLSDKSRTLTRTRIQAHKSTMTDLNTLTC